MHSEKKSLLCPLCRRLISSDEAECPYCGLSRPGSWWKKTLSVPALKNPEEGVTFLIYVNIAFFILSILIRPAHIGISFNPLTFFSPSNDTLLLLGASGTIPIQMYHQWSSLISASFLHGSILHILFNMMALKQLGPFVVHEFGFNRFVIIYIVSGIIGFFLSYLAGIPFTIGASASLTGLIGAIMYFGKVRGGLYGQAIYRQAMSWVFGLVLFGLLVPGINNWAHGGGFVAGILLAFILEYQDRRPESLADRVIGKACLILTALVLIWAVIRALSVLFLSAQ
jgi:rhomboid protease GluP